jgi:hypothetical protein
MLQKLLFAAILVVSVVPVSAQTRNDYSKADTWLCRPGRQDACAVDLSTTVVAADGMLTREEFTPNPNAAIDCFYVYPTVSTDKSANSDMIADPAERGVVRSQLARFGSQCRLFAPLYRQVTLLALRAGTAGKPMPVDRELAYRDVLDAWNHYLTHDNGSRGVVLIGHSQGSGVLARLIRDEIDGKPIQSRLVSALLLGSNVAVPTGQQVGGAFKNVPLCRTASQTGCVITYVSFRSTIPPPADTRFGRVQGAGMEAGCTNPAALAGGAGELKAYLSTGGSTITGSGAPARPWVTPEKPIDTPFVQVPGLLTGRCVSNVKGSYLEVTVNAVPSDPRTDEISGDVMAAGKPNASWGLHLIDVNLGIGNLLDIVAQQAKAFTARQPSR